MSGVAARLEAVRQRIVQAARRAGRDPAEVELVAVSKRQPPEAILEALAAGQRIFGENYVQEAQGKVEALGSAGAGLCWHLIGHLQKNKVRRAVQLFDLIHTVDSLALARRISRIAEELGRRPEVMIQVNIGGEPSKAGVAPEEALGLAQEVAALPGLRLVGLMTIHPYTPDPEGARPWFARMFRLFQEVRAGVGSSLCHLSMGMSNDFEIAVEEGATMVRVGTAIFGPRQG